MWLESHLNIFGYIIKHFWCATCLSRFFSAHSNVLNSFNFLAQNLVNCPGVFWRNAEHEGEMVHCFCLPGKSLSSGIWSVHFSNMWKLTVTIFTCVLFDWIDIYLWRLRNRFRQSLHQSNYLFENVPLESLIKIWHINHLTILLNLQYYSVWYILSFYILNYCRKSILKFRNKIIRRQQLVKIPWLFKYHDVL